MRFRKSEFKSLEPWGYFSPVYWAKNGSTWGKLRFKFRDKHGKVKTVKCGAFIPGYSVFVKRIEASGLIELAPDYKEIPENIYLGSVCNT